MLGEVIHGYRIDRALAADKGGFGDVFFATHVSSGAEAVVKVLKPEMSVLHDIVERFFNEARAAASIHHPGIVQIHNVGYHQGRAYLLMERLRGDDLEGRLARGPLPIERAVTFVRQTAGAIGAAHEHGVIHRDLKPANLFVVADPDVVGGERVKVLDFGIAKLSVDAGAGKTRGVFGTPSYMSPEQCTSAGAVDGRTDLYSLGCIFYELVCGRPPFGHGGAELIAAHLRDAPPPPRALAPWLPPPIEQVILRLLEKQPDQRYASCAALIAALDDAARATGLAAASAPQLPRMAASAPYLPAGGGPGTGAALPSTLQLSAGVSVTPPTRKRGLGLWVGLVAVIAAGAVAAVVVVSRRPSSDPVQAAGRASDAGLLAVAPPDAAVPVPDAAAPVPDAAAPVPDAAVLVPDAAVARDAHHAVTPNRHADAGVRDAARGLPDDEESTAKPGRLSGSAEQAAKLISEAKRDAYSGRYEQALVAFQQAYTLAPLPQTLLSVCVMQSQIVAQCNEARATCQHVLSTWPRDPVAKKAQELLSRLSCP